MGKVWEWMEELEEMPKENIDEDEFDTHGRAEVG